jgi:hypothetical protein
MQPTRRLSLVGARLIWRRWADKDKSLSRSPKMESADNLAKYAKQRYEAATLIREKSVTAFLVERLFRGLQRLSPGSRLLGTETDWYVIAWLAIAALLAVFSWWWQPELPLVLKVFLLGAACLRVLDVAQVVVNLALFDWLGLSQPSSRDVQPVQDVTRSLVMLLWNFFELMLWFGLAYTALSFHEGNVPFWSRFYFSAITQLTVGYGDFTPVGVGQLVAVAQGILAWTVTVVVIARFVASLPRIQGMAPK